MNIIQFEDIKAWQKAQDLAVDVYDLFRNLRNYGFKDQICRASVSVSNNIAEGFERESDADFARFLTISRGSCGEVRSMLYLAKRLHHIDDQQQTRMIDNCQQTSRMIRGFSNYLNESKKKR